MKGSERFWVGRRFGEVSDVVWCGGGGSWGCGALCIGPVFVLFSVIVWEYDGCGTVSFYLGELIAARFHPVLGTEYLVSSVCFPPPSRLYHHKDSRKQKPGLMMKNVLCKVRN